MPDETADAAARATWKDPPVFREVFLLHLPPGGSS